MITSGGPTSIPSDRMDLVEKYGFHIPGPRYIIQNCFNSVIYNMRSGWNIQPSGLDFLPDLSTISL